MEEPSLVCEMPQTIDQDVKTECSLMFMLSVIFMTVKK